MKNINPVALKLALSWFKALPSAKKKYLREHCNLNNNRKLTGYFTAQVATPEQLAFIKESNHGTN